MKSKKLINVILKFQPNRFSNDIESDVYRRLYPQQKRSVTEQAHLPNTQNKKPHIKEQKS